MDVGRPLGIQVMSDLHLEFPFRNSTGDDSVLGYQAFDCTPSAPILALLGDIGLIAHDELFIFLERQLFKYDKIFFLLGNHEYYRIDYDQAKARIKAFADNMEINRSSDDSRGQFILLDRTRYDLTDEVTILGCTLWSYIPPTACEMVNCLNDFKRINGWSIECHNSAHALESEWLDREYAKINAEEPGRRVVIFTHHAPTLQAIAPEYRNSLTNHAYATDMTTRSCWARPVSLWAFGHTHYKCDFVYDNIRCVSNPRGYEGIEASRSGFIEDFVLYV